MGVKDKMNIICLNNVSKCYGEEEAKTFALNNISLEISAGEMVSVMGRSGSGKSSLLNIIGCLDVPTEGKYYIENIDASNISKYELARIRNQKVGFVFQQFALLNEYSVFDNIELPLIYGNKFRSINNKYTTSKRKKLVFEMVESVGLTKHISKRPSQISGGQQQRVAIARALIANPSIILADEPTGALDLETGKEIMNLLIEINRKGRTIIIVTHDNNVASLCNRKVLLQDGKII